MCDPVSLAAAGTAFTAALPYITAATAVVGAGTALEGSMQSAKAQSSAANAISQQNLATQQAQNQGFTERNQAAQQQTAAQFSAEQQTLAQQQEAAQQMRAQQSSALSGTSNTLAALNTQEDQLRQVGDQGAQDLLSQTSGPALQAAQQGQVAEASALLQPGLASATAGPSATDPSGGTNPISADAGSNDPAMASALARRTAEAATNIRQYGSKIADLASYSAPTQATNIAITGNRTGIMPAEDADQLLRSGASTMLLPSQVAYQTATNEGGAMNTLLQNEGQNRLDAASLAAGNATDIANLGQGDATTIAANQAAQAKANAAYNASIGSLISGIGNLGVQAGAQYGGLSTLFGTGAAVSPATVAANKAYQQGAFAQLPAGTEGPLQ